MDYMKTHWQGLLWALKDWAKGQDPFWTDYLIVPRFAEIERLLRRSWCQRHSCIPYSPLSWKYTNPPRCYRCGEEVKNVLK